VEQLLALAQQYITDDASLSYVCAFDFELIPNTISKSSVECEKKRGFPRN
jgi:hypothetical protein